MIIFECANYSCKLGTCLIFLFDCKSSIDLLHANIFPFSPPTNINEWERSNSNDDILVRGRILYKFNSNIPSRFLRLYTRIFELDVRHMRVNGWMVLLNLICFASSGSVILFFNRR